MDYLLPTTTEVPDIEIGHIETESTTNPGGFKGMGEGGAIGSHAAVANAVADALGRSASKATKTPLGPEDIFALVEAARSGLSIDVDHDHAPARSSPSRSIGPSDSTHLDLEHVARVVRRVRALAIDDGVRAGHADRRRAWVLCGR